MTSNGGTNSTRSGIGIRVGVKGTYIIGADMSKRQWGTLRTWT